MMLFKLYFERRTVKVLALLLLLVGLASLVLFVAAWKHSDDRDIRRADTQAALEARPELKTETARPVQLIPSALENNAASGVQQANYLPLTDEARIELCQYAEIGPTRILQGVDSQPPQNHAGEPRWSDSKLVPFEAFAYGEYVGPPRTPHMNQYQLHIGDNLEFLYQMTRRTSGEMYRFQVGDELQIRSGLRAELFQERLIIAPDGTISPAELGPLLVSGKTIQQVQDLLNKRYAEGGNIDPAITVMALKSNTELEDLIGSIRGVFNQGGIVRQSRIHPDGSVHLPRVGRVPALGLTIEELTQEINFRYAQIVGGLHVSAMLIQRGPRFIYVLGEVASEGRFEMTAPTTALQALALAGGENQGGNLRQIVVLRRDEHWRLVATKLDLYGAVYGKRPQPSDEIWLRDSDIVIVPKMPIQRVNELVNMYITRTIYSVVPNAGVSFQFGGNTSF
jgi:polysaccharide export outer membrane protein